MTVNLDKLRALAEGHLSGRLSHPDELDCCTFARACLALCDCLTQSDDNGPHVIDEQRELARVLEELGL
jgi:hypothetical protein